MPNPKGTELTWLEESRHNRRSVKRAGTPPPLKDIYNQLSKASLNYRANRELTTIEHRAIPSFIILTCCRVSEITGNPHRIIRRRVKGQRKRIRMEEALRPLSRAKIQRRRGKWFVIDIETEKGGEIRKPVELPEQGILAPFTRLFLDWLKHVENPEYPIFPASKPLSEEMEWEQALTRTSLHRIIKKLTGKYPHYYRHVGETIYARFFERDPYELKEFLGLQTIEATSSYVHLPGEQYRSNIYNMKED